MQQVPSIPSWHHPTTSLWLLPTFSPQIWCLANESRFHINQSVEGSVLVAVLQGLVPGVLYHAEVAATTSAGVGARSVPIPIRVGEFLAAPMGSGWPRSLLSAPTAVSHVSAAFPVQRDMGMAGGSSVARRLAAMARQPVFIASVGGTCWLILAAVAAWLYSRRRRKKELSHFTGTMGCHPWEPHLTIYHPNSIIRLSPCSILCLRTQWEAHGDSAWSPAILIPTSSRSRLPGSGTQVTALVFPPCSWDSQCIPSSHLLAGQPQVVVIHGWQTHGVVVAAAA